MAVLQKKHVRVKSLPLRERTVGKDLGARWLRLLTAEVTGKELEEADTNGGLHKNSLGIIRRKQWSKSPNHGETYKWVKEAVPSGKSHVIENMGQARHRTEEEEKDEG